eukprot:PITA_29052
MEALEAAMKKHNFHLEHSSTSTSSSGIALSAYGCQASRSGYALNVSSSSHSHEWLIDFGASYHMAKNKAMFSSLNDCNTKNIYVGDDRSLSVVGGGTIHLDNGQFNDVLCVPTLSCNLLSVYQITHLGEGKIVEFSPHDIVIKDLRDPRQILATGIADDSTRLYKVNKFGSSTLTLVFVAHNDEVGKLWHERFGHLNYRSLQNLCKENMVTEAINCANYIVNRTLTKVLKNITLEEAWSSIKPEVSHFHVFGSEAWAHIPNEKHKALEPKSEKCIFVGYSEDVNGYRLIPLESKNVIIRRDVNFAENISAYEPSLADVPHLSILSTSENISSSNDDSEDDNPPPPSQGPPSSPQLRKWVRATRDATGALAGDTPTDQRCTHSQFDRASSLVAQASANYDPDTFAEASGHPDWDAAMNEEYRSLLANDTWDLVLLPKGRKLVRCKWIYRTKFGLDGKVDKHKACLVAKGFSQVEGIDYSETFSPVAKMNSICLILSLAASFKWEVH